jgi:hypothetical protein
VSKSNQKVSIMKKKFAMYLPFIGIIKTCESINDGDMRLFDFYFLTTSIIHLIYLLNLTKIIFQWKLILESASH